MEYLSNLIADELVGGRWAGVKPTPGCVPFTNLLFADDIILTGVCNKETFGAVHSIIEKFCRESGMKINHLKSRILFSKNTGASYNHLLSTTMGIAITEDLGKYLGFPISLAKAKEKDLSFIVDQVRAKLAGWQANMLSMAGRVVLIESVTSAIPSYTMQCSLLPKKVSHTIDRLNRDFLWGSTANKRKLHLVSWEEVTRPKERGGLGIKQMGLRNKALLGGFVARALKCHAPWAELLRKRYGRPNARRMGYSSANWRALKSGLEVWDAGARWRIGSGEQTSFWFDRWACQKPLRELIFGPLPRGEAERKVASVITSSREWDLSSVPFLLPNACLQLVRGSPLSTHAICQDSQYWGLSQSGDYETKSAYNYLTTMSQEPLKSTWSWIWKTFTLPRIQNFIWLCTKDRLATLSLLSARGMQVDVTCPRCQKAPENSLHILRECPFAVDFWKATRIPDQLRQSFNLPLAKWLQANCRSKKSSHLSMEWGSLFTFAIWTLWKNRNSLHFSHQALGANLPSLTLQVAAEFSAMAPIRSANPKSRQVFVCWNPPPEGFFKLNTDGSSLGNPGQAGGGGLIRDDRGNWIWGYAMNLGYTTSVIAELLALRHGLSLALSKGIRKLYVEFDARLLLDWVWGESLSNALLNPIVTDCRILKQQMEVVIPGHVFREANSNADALARLGSSCKEQLLVFDSAPSSIACFVLKYLRGLGTSRRVTDIG